MLAGIFCRGKEAFSFPDGLTARFCARLISCQELPELQPLITAIMYL